MNISKTILITGAARGIGAALCRQLSTQGHRIIAVSRNVEKLKKLQSEIAEHNPQHQIEIIPFDLEAPEMIPAFIDRIKAYCSSIDVLIHNAGMLVNKPFNTISGEELQRVYQVNVFGPFALTQALYPYLRQAGGAHIIGISSMGGVQGSAKFAGLTAYSSSKAAMAGWCEVLAEEWKEEQIKVNCLALGAAQTEMLEEAFPGYKAPLTAEDMANYISWFALNGHLYFNGKILPVAVSTP
ncbi:MAG: SDR family NAD(P)-dependent oxidoreductase [Bacteroidia bacterium]